MLEEIVVHVGMNKTGSSSIQQTFGRLPMEDVEYLQVGAYNHSGFFSTLLSSSPEKYHAHVAGGRGKEDALRMQRRYSDRLEKALCAVSKKTLLISSEDLSWAPTRDLQKLRSILVKHCSKIRVIGYVRPPVAYMQSDFQQRVKAGVQADFSIKKLFPAYKRRFSRIDSVFGTRAVELVPFLPEHLYERDVVRDFGRRIGVEVDGGEVVKANESLSLEATALLYTARRFGVRCSYRDFRSDEAARVAALSRLGGERLAFAPCVVQPILDAFQDDIRWMNSRLGCSIEDGPNPRGRTIASENDLFAIASEQKAALWGLVNELSSISSTIESVAELVDRLLTLHALGPQVVQTASTEFMEIWDGVRLADEALSPAEILSSAAAALAGSDPDISIRFEQLARRAARRANLTTRTAEDDPQLKAR